MASRIGVGELYPLLGQTIYVGSFIKRASKTAYIPPTHIVHQKENHVRPLGCIGGQKTKRTAQHYLEKSFHGDRILPNPPLCGNAWLS